MKKRLLITVKGKVQNVGFRYFTNKRAMEFNISGFVKNQSDGTVYIEAEGAEDELNTFLDHVKQGPKWGRVDDVKLQEAPVNGDEGFSIR
jgi:acylphosphatase